jgi:6-phosphogluconolactonase
MNAAGRYASTDTGAGGSTRIIVLPDAAVLAETVAARLVMAVLDAQADHGSAAVVLTGGTIAAKVYATVRDSGLRNAVDWSRVDFWWGDERFLPAGHPDRNETQARAAFLDALPVDPARLHPMPWSDGVDGADADAAAARYAALLAAAAGADPSGLPRFDVLLLGVGEDGHIASIFPDHPLHTPTSTVSAVTGSPKPPPVRLTLSLPAINTAREIWLVAAGAGKAQAVGAALAGAAPLLVPAAGAAATGHTLWLLDRAAAAEALAG